MTFVGSSKANDCGLFAPHSFFSDSPYLIG